jgi:hypothetical protein
MSNCPYCLKQFFSKHTVATHVRTCPIKHIADNESLENINYIIGKLLEKHRITLEVDDFDIPLPDVKDVFYEETYNLCFYPKLNVVIGYRNDSIIPLKRLTQEHKDLLDKTSIKYVSEVPQEIFDNITSSW